MYFSPNDASLCDLQYQRALRAHDCSEKQNALFLARATREALILEEELAKSRVKEGELALNVLKANVQRAHVHVEEAEYQIGAVRAVLAMDGISEVPVSEDDGNLRRVPPSSDFLSEPTTKSSSEDEDLNTCEFCPFVTRVVLTFSI